MPDGLRRQVLGALGLLLLTAPAVPAAGTRILLVARDREEHLLPRFRFAYGGLESQPTDQAGATELELPPDHRPGQQIKIHLMPGSKQAEDWFLVNQQVNIPVGSVSAELVLMRRKEFRQLAAEVRDTPKEAPVRPGAPAAEGLKRALADAAAHYGLTAEQLETAIHSFADTQNQGDRGIAAYLGGQYSQAEKILKGTVEKQEDDLVESLRYLGGSQYEQAEYSAAIESFRKALAFRADDADVLSRLGETLAKLAEWAESETLLRRALAIYEKSTSPEDPKITGALNNLAVLLYLTNRAAEAEPLMRWALAIDQKRFGPEHPDVARDLQNLAALLDDTHRSDEAEGLLRSALPILEKSFGREHSNVAALLTDLAALLYKTNRAAEAEPLMRRALAIDEKSLGPDHPDVATLLSNLATLCLDTNRVAEADPLLRRAVAIDEKSFGPDHPKVAGLLNNQATLYMATGRMAEAEPLLRRALAIFEKSLGPEHPRIASMLFNLSWVLQEMKHFAEAEPLLRRAVIILLDDSRRTGREHPDQDAFSKAYRSLLEKMDKSPAEIDAMIEGLARPSK